MHLSGHNRDSYIEWIRESMNGDSGRVSQEDRIDEDTPPEESNIDSAERESGSDTDYNSTDDGVNVDSSPNKETKDVYFKGFIAFLLWGFIPPPGGEMLKSMQGLN